MATSIVNAPITLDGEADDESGHRTYRVVFRVVSDDPRFDGPAVVMQTPGLPLPGSVYAFGNDLDVYAWCRPGMRVRRARGVRDRGPVRYYDVERVFSTRPPALGGGTSSGRPGSSGGGNSGNRRGCHDGRVEDPLLEPMGISGDFVKRTDKTGTDVWGNQILNSAWYQMSGDETEFEFSNPTVTIEQNVPDLQLFLCSSMTDTLNDDELWGLPARVWRLAEFSWEQKFHGLCYPYYVRRFKFEANYRYETDAWSGEVVLRPAWDRVLDDAGPTALSGRWGTVPETGTSVVNTGWQLVNIGSVTPDPSNPTHFKRYRDREGNFGTTVLNGMGQPYDPDDAYRDFWWVYSTGGGSGSSSLILTVFNGTYNAAQALSAVDETVADDVPDVFGPFYSSDQATAAKDAPDLIVFEPGLWLSGTGRWRTVNNRYRAWSGQDAFPAPGRIEVMKYAESNFLLLGIPVILG